MNKKLLSYVFIAFFFFSVLIISQIASCQTVTPGATATPTPEKSAQESALNLFLIVGIIAIVVAVAGVAAFAVSKKRRVNEKSLRKFSSPNFEEWVIKRFNGKPSDPSSGVNGFTEGGQPLLIVQSDHVSLADVEDFVKALVKGKAQKGTIIALNFDKDTFEGKIKAMDNGIELQLLPINELLNKRFSKRIDSLARSPVTFEAPLAGMAEDRVTEIRSFEKMSNMPQKEGLKPRVFISNSNTKVADQVKKMLDFLHYDYVIGDKEETTVPISDNKFGLMRNCDCAIINIAAVEQERRYSGLYVLNSNVISEINAAYLKYNMQVVLLVERKVELPPNLKGLKRIEYNSDDLSFNAAMDLEKALTDFKKI
ncbi:MAG TPA: hypothetical protein VK253_07690 [Candidatus Binatia bacterium]|nr:hypothetical protein [Candidatus Binatia bacterium]